MTRAAFGFLALIGLLAFLALGSLLFGGCVYRGAKITEGTDLAVGISLPGTDGILSCQALNYLSGFRLGVAEGSALTVAYTTAETNSYFGVVSTRSAKTVRATVTPQGSALAAPAASQEPAPDAPPAAPASDAP